MYKTKDSNFSQTEECDSKFINFSGFYDTGQSAEKAVILLAFLLDCFNGLLLYGIIWYEHFGNDAKRILSNKLVSTSWYQFQ